MKIRRREFIGTASAAMVAGMATAKLASAQEGNAPAKTPPVPTRQAKVERLFKAPDVHPNALEAAPDGLWIGGQVSEKVFRVDWKTGKALHEVQTESHNTSGIAVGAGYLWLGANGGVSGRRPPRPDRRRSSDSEDRSGLRQGARDRDALQDVRPGPARDVHPRRLHVLLRCRPDRSRPWQRTGSDLPVED